MNPQANDPSPSLRHGARWLPALVVGVGILAATALAVALPPSGWASVVVIAALVLALLGADLVRSLGTGQRWRPSPVVLVIAGTIAVACGILATSGPDRFVPMIPILGSTGALPFLEPRRRTGGGPAASNPRACAP